MKKFIKIISLALCAVLIMPILAACGPSGEGEFEFEGSALSSGKVGVAYSASVSATGADDVEYLIQPGYSLPGGLTLAPGGAISGTPTESGSKTIKIVAYSESLDKELDADFTITIDKGIISYSGATLENGATNEPYSALVATATAALSNANVTYALKSGSTLPEGLNLSAAGNITGFPEEEIDGYSFTVVASAEHHISAEASFEISIEEGFIPIIDDHLTFEGKPLTVGEVGTPYSYALRANGALPQDITYTYTFNSTYGTALPPGLEFDNATGIISGIPKDSTSGMSEADKSGTLQFRIKASALGYEDVYAVFSLKILDKEVTTDRFHAAMLDVTYLTGTGWSGGANGSEMLHNTTDSTVTGPDGMYLGYLHIPGNTIEFAFDSDRAGTGSLAINVSTEFRPMAFNKDNYIVKVNGAPINYTAFNIRNADDIGALSDTPSDADTKTAKFQRFVLSISVEIQEGANTISFTLMENDYMREGTAAGPELDYCEILNTGAVLTWRPKVYNKVLHFGS